MASDFLGSSNGTDTDPSVAYKFLEAAQSFNQVYTPLLCLFGAVGNCVSVTVFCRTSRHRNLSSSYYLSALAISDTGFLLSLLAVWLEDMGLHVITTPLTCPLVMYLGQVTCFLSVWFIVAFTMERFFAVCYPLTRPTVCTVARAKRIIGGLTLFALLIFSYVWVIARVMEILVDRYPTAVPTTTTANNTSNLASSLMDTLSEMNSMNDSDFRYGNNYYINGGTTTPAGDKDNDDYTDQLGVADTMKRTTGYPNPASIPDYETMCSVPEEYVYFSSIASHIDSVLTFILPFGIISYLNIRIALCVWRLRDQRDSLVAVARITRQNSNCGGASTTRTQVGFVYRSSIRHGNQVVNNGMRQQHNNGSAPSTTASMNHLNLSNPVNYRSKTNLAVDFEPSENSSTTSTLNNHYCCTEFPPQRGGRYKCPTNKKVERGRVRSKVKTANSASHSRAEARVTKTLLLVSTVFLVLNLPSHAIRAASFLLSFWKEDEDRGRLELEILHAGQRWANILFNMNFGVNFLLYCMSGKNFRISVKKIFCRVSGLGDPRRHLKKSKKRAASPIITGNHSPLMELSSSHRPSLYPVSITEMDAYTSRCGSPHIRERIDAARDEYYHQHNCLRGR